MKTIINCMIVFDIIFLIEDHPGAALLCFIGLIILNKGGFEDVY